MAQQDAIVNMARSQIGVMEDKYRNVIYSAEFGKPRLDWCAMFVWWVFKECGLSNTIGNFKTAGCTTFKNWAVNHNMFYTTGQYGDICLFKWSNDGYCHHMGIVTEYSDGKVTTVDGNTDAQGYQYPCVAEKTRSTQYVYGFIRPNYDGASVPTPVVPPTRPVVVSPTYSVDPILAPMRVMHLHLDPIATTEDLYDRVTQVLKEGYGLIDDTVVNLYSDMNKRNATHTNAWNRFIASTSQKMIVLWEGSSIGRYIYILIGAQETIGYVDISYNALAGFRLRVYDENGIGITSNVQITVVSPSRQQSFVYPYPQAFYNTNYIGGYYFLSNGYGTGSTYFYEPNDMDIRTNSFSWEMIELSSRDEDIIDPDPDPSPEGVIYMYLNIWRNFSKKYNSTLQPINGDRLEVLLMKDTSLRNPRIQLKSTILDYNYFQLFGRFYYITDCIALRNGMIEIQGKIDPFATCKSSILATNAYVERSESSYNVMLKDNYVDVEAEDEIITTTMTSSSVWFNNVGVYILSVINNLSNTNMLCRYLLLPSELEKLSNYFNINFNNWSGLNDLLSWLQAISFKTAGAVMDLKWMPLIASYPTQQAGVFSSAEDIKVGEDILTGIKGYRYLESNPTTDGIVFTANSLGYTRSDFRRQAPYTRLRVFIPFHGFVELDPLDFPQGMKLQYNLDYATGDCVVLIQSVVDNTTTTVETVRFSMSATMPIANGNGGGVEIPVIGSLSKIVGAEPIFGSNYQSKGSTEGRAWSLELTPFVQVIERDTTVVTTVLGRPVNRNFTLSNLSGYCKCRDASVSCILPDDLKNEINNAMNSGFYIE